MDGPGNQHQARNEAHDDAAVQEVVPGPAVYVAAEQNKRERFGAPDAFHGPDTRRKRNFKKALCTTKEAVGSESSVLADGVATAK